MHGGAACISKLFVISRVRSLPAGAGALGAPLSGSGLVGWQMLVALGAWCCTAILEHPNGALSIPTELWASQTNSEDPSQDLGIPKEPWASQRSSEPPWSQATCRRGGTLVHVRTRTRELKRQQVDESLEPQVYISEHHLSF